MDFRFALLGATGFTGSLVAEYLAGKAAPETRWAIAGRNRAKLDALAQRIADAGGVVPRVVGADVTATADLRELAERSGVLASTVGPYALYGEPVVAACAETGTDYCDLAGEPEFVDRMWLDHHEQAQRTGARLVHACGFDSVPHDLGVWHHLGQLPEDVPLTVRGYVTVSAEFSAGTYHSAVRAFARLRQARSTAAARRKRESRPEGRRVRAVSQRPGRGPDGAGWTLPLPTIDPLVVRRSARALERYGPDFSYGHYVLFDRVTSAAAVGVGAAGALAVAQVPPGRDLLLRLRSPGDGPTPQRRERAWYRVRFVGEGGGTSAVTEVCGGDPGYDETARMLGEAMLCLAHDELPRTVGQVTTAEAMGDALLNRLDFARVL